MRKISHGVEKRNLDESAAVQEGQIKSDEKDIMHDGSRRSKDDHHVIPVRRKMSDDYGHTAAVHDYCIATSECVPSEKFIQPQGHAICASAVHPKF